VLAHGEGYGLTVIQPNSRIWYGALCACLCRFSNVDADAMVTTRGHGRKLGLGLCLESQARSIFERARKVRRDFDLFLAPPVDVGVQYFNELIDGRESPVSMMDKLRFSRPKQPGTPRYQASILSVTSNKSAPRP
jgi:hypothetical protein